MAPCAMRRALAAVAAAAVLCAHGTIAGHASGYTVNECTETCSTCAGTTCSDNAQTCHDPDTSGYVLKDWTCNCVSPQSGSAVGRAANCRIDECTATCATCEAGACDAQSPPQSCVDLDTAIDQLSTWVCRCDAPLTGQTALAPSANCTLDECTAVCPTCQGVGGPKCEEAAIPQTCVDTNTSMHATSDWICNCTAPYVGEELTFITLCMLDECTATCDGCYDGTSCTGNTTCIDPNTDPYSRRDWMCGVDECVNHTCGGFCIDPDMSPTAIGDVYCAEDECTSATNGTATCAAGGQTCSDPDIRVAGDWVCECAAPQSTTDNVNQVGTCMDAPTPVTATPYGMVLTFDQGDTGAVGQAAAQDLSNAQYVNPPSSVAATNQHTDVHLSGQGIVDKVGTVRSLVWWFRLDGDTDIANFYIDANSSGWDGDYEYRFIVPHYSNTFRIKASTYDGIQVESPFLPQEPRRMEPGNCGKPPGQHYRVLKNTWHQLAVDIHYRVPDWTGWRVWGSEAFDEPYPATFFDVTFDRYPVCDGVLWNHTTSAADWLHFTKFHFSGGVRQLDPFCEDVAAAPICTGDGGGSVSVDVLSICNTTAAECAPTHRYRAFDCGTYLTRDECGGHMRCHWRRDAGMCVESTLSRLYEVREQHTAAAMVYTTSNMLAAGGFAAVGQQWFVSAGAITFGSTTPGVLRSPEFTVGPGTVITVTLVGSATVSAAFARSMHNALVSRPRGFRGVAISWRGGWVLGRSVCPQAVESCEIVLTPDDLGEVLHEPVTLDIVDADSVAAMAVYGVTIDRPLRAYADATAPLTPPPSGFFTGLPCKGVGFEESTWRGITCEGPRATDIGVIKVNHEYLGGSLDELDFGMYPDLHTLNLNENQLVGDGLATINDTHYLPDALEELSLGNNRLSGVLPVLRFSPNLKRLNLSYQGFQGQLPPRYFQPPQPPEPNQVFQEIHTVDNRVVVVDLPVEPVNPGPYDFAMLDVSGNPGVTGTIPFNFSRHPTFEVFRANGCNLKGEIPSPLGPRMRLLDVSNNALTGVAPFIEDQNDPRWEFVGLANTSLVGLIPDWIKNARRWELGGSNWCCPIPHWSLYQPPYYTLSSEDPEGNAEIAFAAPRYTPVEEGGQPTWPLLPSLHWLRELPNGTYTPPTCGHPDQNGASASDAQDCPVVKGPCDGAITCRNLRCKSDASRAPGYDVCGCDMRRARCVYRTDYAPPEDLCQRTSDHNGNKTHGVCVDTSNEFAQTNQPGTGIYFGPPGTEAYVPSAP